jgi:tRNA threonylcarbamoyladenosine biosynthesis protein TsaB
MNDRLILAVDTSFGPVGAALATFGGEIVASVEADNSAGTQAETLPPLIARMNIDFGQLKRIAVTVGPGAFTGVRVGLAFAKGLRLATGADVLGVTTLECLAAQAALKVSDHAVGVAIDAKRGEVYVQAFAPSLTPLCEAALLPIAEAARLLQATLIQPFVLTGSGASLIEGVAKHRLVAVPRIDTKLLACRAVSFDTASYPAIPAYLRAPDARLPA